MCKEIARRIQVFRFIFVLYILLLGEYRENIYIKSFFRLRILWVVNLIDSLVCDVGSVVMLQ